ncbi:uncharacterized protein LOC134278348 [Saccostrea cucullata]|uniref:uncharacterized protein LOC134278348 n=1 Tax=Saccostrea cuccullata TaxID=36930 RepID=UPI002ED20E88
MMTKTVLRLAFLCGICTVVELLSPCVKCQNDETCKAPDCFCCRSELNLPIPLKNTPQIVYFTFDDALTDAASKFYRKLFNETRMNPNGCPISMTMFISHQDTIYRNVKDFYERGMEIASHSVTHSHMKTSNFMQEAKKQKRNLAKFGGIPENEIVGWRSPFLEPVGDMQPEKLKELGYLYDATLTFSKRKLTDKAPTPFTLDFGWPYDCKVKPCPKRRHSGFWEVPVVSLLDYKHKYDCVYVDGCNNPPPNEASAYQFLMDNFNSYYTTSRNPFGINMHPSWFYIPDRLNAMDRFINTLLKMDDVYIVSVEKTIRWLQNPTPLSELHSFEPWKCDHVKNKQQANTATTNNRRHMGLSPMEKQHMYIQQRLQKIAEMRREIELKRQRELQIEIALKKQRELELIQGQTDYANRDWWSPPRRHSNNIPQSPFTEEIPNAHVLDTPVDETPLELNKQEDRVASKSSTNSKRPVWEHKSKRNKSSTKSNLSNREQILNRNQQKQSSSTQTKIVPFWQQGQLGSRRLPEAAFQRDSRWWNKPVPYVNDFKYMVAYSVSTKPPSVTTAKIAASTESPPTTYKPPSPPRRSAGVDLFREKQLIEYQRRQRLILENQRKREEKQLKQQRQELRKNEKESFTKQQRSRSKHKPYFTWREIIPSSKHR